MYKSVKSSKPWVRVGVSPFGIWRPAFPAALKREWTPTSIWRATPASGFPADGWITWPPSFTGAAAGQAELSRIDAMVGRPELQTPGVARHCHGTYHEQRRPGPPASEIAAQVNYSRSLARTAPGQCFWSIKSIMRNAGGIQKYLNRLYPSMAVPPAMPWCGTGTPGQPQNFYVADNGSTVTLSWQPSGNPSRKWAVQARYGSQWATRILLPGSQTRVTLPKSFLGDAGSVAVRGVSVYGAQGPAAAARR